VTEPFWLTKEFILALHERLLAEFGGLDGIRDEGLLESALGKPLNLFAYGEPTAPELAASYAFGIVRNHPFLDGNKRTGFAAAAVFLETNGFRLTATEVEATLAALALAEGALSERKYAAWLTEHSERAGDSPKEKPKRKKRKPR
jgi:death-on-curing protein